MQQCVKIYTHRQNALPLKEMRFFLKVIYVFSLLCLVVAFSAPQTHAQYHVPQETQEQEIETEGRSFWFWNRRPKPRITYNQRQTRPQKTERATLDELFPMDHDVESSMAHIDTTNRLKTPIQPGAQSFPTQEGSGDNAGAKSRCSPKQRTAIRAIQKYLDRKSKNIILTANDKKVAAFMQTPENVAKARELASFCNMSLAIN